MANIQRFTRRDAGILAVKLKKDNKRLENETKKQKKKKSDEWHEIVGALNFN